MLLRNASAFFLALFIVACGEDDPESNDNSNDNANPDPIEVTCNETFDQPDACGGDPTGSWRLGAVCGDGLSETADELSALCPTVTVGDASTETEGTLVIDAETYTERFIGSATADVNIPSECLSLVPNTPPLTCDTLAALVSNEEGLEGTCTDGAEESCDCTITIDLSFETTGSYATADGVATITTSDATLEYYYCVEGDQLTLRETEASESPTRSVFAYGR